MKQILLAIDGDVPSRPVFQYAVDLCRQVRAQLCILQFTKGGWMASPPPDRSVERERSGKIGEADKVLTGVPGPLRRMLKSPGFRVPFTVALSAGNLEKDLSEYVDTHHDIILTVYDPSEDLDRPRASRNRLGRIDGLKGKLGVPLVVVNAAKSPSSPSKRPSFRT